MRKWTSFLLVFALIALFAMPVSATERLSTGLINAITGKQADIVACNVDDDIALVDGGGGSDTITAVGNDFITAGLQTGDFIYVFGATVAADNLTGTQATTVAAGTITLPTSTFDTGQIAGNPLAICAARGGSLRDLFHRGVIRIYSGSQPASADTAESGTLLVTITSSSGAFVAGAPSNGLEFEAPTAGVLPKSTTQTWSGTAAATGTAGWGRLYDNAYTTGASSTAVRYDFSVGTSGADLNLSSTSIVSGATITIDTFTITQPDD